MSLDQEEIEQLTIEGGPMAENSKIVIQKMSLNKIKLGKNSRTAISKEELSGLMQSIKEVGLLQPIGVVKNGTGYEICYGNRRFLACSKLGFTQVPVVVHERKKESDIDLKNLTENIQRRNISLSEAGRYIKLLKEQGLTSDEIAVRLGTSRSYVASCLNAFGAVPEKYQKDLDISVGGPKRSNAAKAHGKIAVSTAMAIVNAAKSYGLSADQKEELFRLSKSDDRYIAENTRRYAAAIKSGVSEPLEKVKPLTHARLQFWVKKEDMAALHEKYVASGPFDSMSALFKAILKGEKAIKIPIVEGYK